MATSKVQPFRFLNLPVELRFMVYERIDADVTHRTCAFLPYELGSRRTRNTSMSLVFKTLPMAILATCHEMRNETRKIMGVKLREIAEEPMRLIIDSCSVEYFSTEAAEAEEASLVNLGRVPEPSLFTCPDSGTQNGEPSMGLPHFVDMCLVFVVHRRPASTEIVIMRQITDQLSSTVQRVHRYSDDLMASFLPGHLKLILRGASTDATQDIFHPYFPLGYEISRFLGLGNSVLGLNSAWNASGVRMQDTCLDTAYDISEEEWKKD